MLCDYSGMSETKCLEQLHELEKRMQGGERHPLILVDVSNATLGPEFMRESKRVATQAVERPLKQAILGIEGLKSMLLKAYNAFSRSGGLHPYKTRDEALAFLVS